MDGKQLSQLINARFETLQRLMNISQQQVDAIREGRMSDLMRLLSDKQQPLNALLESADRLRDALDDDPVARTWESEQARAQCAAQQQACEKLHLELLAIEAECETALQHSRATIQEQLDRVDATRLAASGYADAHHVPTRGGQLDLSSD